MKTHDQQPRLRLTKRGEFARNSLIAATAIGVSALALSNLSNETPPSEEIACTTQLQQPNLESFSEQFLDASSAAEKKRTSAELARQARLNDPNNIDFGRKLQLTNEQCVLVVDNGGEVTYLETE